MKISQYMVAEVTKRVKDSLISFYNETMRKETNCDFDTYSESLFDEVWEEIKQVNEISYSVIWPHLNRFEATKKRWANKEVKDTDKSLFHQQIDIFAKNIYEQAKLTGKVDSFRDLFECDSFDELRVKRLKELDEWTTNKEKPLLSFPYIQGKKLNQLKKALGNDIRFLTMYHAKKHTPKQPVVSVPSLLTDNFPVDPSNRIKYKELMQGNGTNDYYVNNIIIDDNLTFESRLDVDFLRNEFMEDFLKLMNANDYAVLTYVLSLRGEKFFTTGEIEVDIGDIVRNCGAFKSQGKQNYLAVKASLHKMNNMSYCVVNSSLHGFSVSIFSDVIIYGDDTGDDTSKKSETDTATIWVSRPIIDAYIKNQTVQMYRHIIDGFKLNTSKVLIYALQRTRIELSPSVPKGDVITYRTNLRFFRHYIAFPNKKKTEQIKLIKKTLEEIKDKKITLKDFKIIGDTFILEFYPFSKEEINDLLNQPIDEFSLS